MSVIKLNLKGNKTSPAEQKEAQQHWKNTAALIPHSLNETEHSSDKQQSCSPDKSLCFSLKKTFSTQLQTQVSTRPISTCSLCQNYKTGGNQTTVTELWIKLDRTQSQLALASANLPTLTDLSPDIKTSSLII